MAKNINDIAKQLSELKEKIVLIYAFNNTGKTRLSVEYKNHTKAINDDKHAGVYYNAFSEDLFVWDNDERNGNDDIKLNVIGSSLNQFHQTFSEEPVWEKLTPFKPKYDFYFDVNDPEKGIEAIRFYEKGNLEKSIKISRGEERIFVWCFFLALFEVEGWSDEQAAHFFIDDPVSSLDDNNIFITASTLFKLLEDYVDTRKIIITSHHYGILSILFDWLNKGEKADKFKNNDRQKTKKFISYFLESDGENLKLTKPNKGVMLYHLRLLQIIDTAINKEKRVYTYHLALLRQVLENISSFLGVGQFSHVLREIGITDPARTSDIINALSHQKIYYYQNDIAVPENQKILEDVFNAIQTKYNFVLHND